MSDYPRLTPMGTASTGFGGCIGIDDDTGPMGGFAEIDPNGAIFDDAEADEVAAEMCRRWNAHEDLLSALKDLVALTDRKHAAWDKARAAIAKAGEPTR